MKAWITKYALTQGIYEKEVDVLDNGMIVDRKTGYAQYFHGEGREWHKTLEGARFKAEEMRINKINKLIKQLDKFKKMKF